MGLTGETYPARRKPLLANGGALGAPRGWRERRLRQLSQNHHAGNAHFFCIPRRRWPCRIPPNNEDRRVAGIAAHGLPKCPRRDESSQGGKVRVSAFCGNHLPRPFGTTGGSCAKGESGQLQMLYHCHACGASADICAGGILSPGGARFGVAENGWAEGPSTSGCMPICA